MKMNRKSRRSRPPIDDRMPGKIEVPYERIVVPSYRGTAKTRSAPRPGRGKAKVAFKPREVVRPRPVRGEVELPDMKPRRPSRATGENVVNEQYVRLRIRVRGDQLSVVDSHLVDGPLAQPTTLVGGNAYEVTLGDELLHAGALPDLGIQRSFIAPDAEGEKRSHHIAHREVFEFTARVPAQALTSRTIGQIVVRVHRLKDALRVDALRNQRLGLQFEREVRPVLELHGLPASVLPEAIRRRGAAPK